MAKIYTDRLIKRYKLKPDPEKGWSGKPYRDIIKRIITENSINVSNRIVSINMDGWAKALKKIQPQGAKFIIPDVSDVLPKRSVFIRKAAEKGELISQTMRDSLTKNLRDTMNIFTEKTGEAKYIIRAGQKAGRINPKLIQHFQDNIRGTFEGYVKKNKLLGMPTNIHTISVTEIRSTINEIKGQYVNKLVRKNPDIAMKKKWIQNRSLSKVPRKGHGEVARSKAIPLDESFHVPLYKKIKGTWKLIGSTAMMHPHDPDAPGEQVIGCNCDIDYIAKRKKS